jgi:AcrR family transcriptional regulator
VGAIATKPTIADAGAPEPREAARQGVKGERTRQRIKDGFAELLERKSFASITIADICRTADITVGGLYFHFPSQEELLDEVMAEYVAALTQNLETALEADALAEAVCEAFIETYAQKVGLARTFQQLTRMRADYAARWRTASAQALARLTDRLAAERPELAPDKAAFLAYALVTMIVSKLDLVYVYSDRSSAAGRSAHAALSAQLPQLWRRMSAAEPAS